MSTENSSKLVSFMIATCRNTIEWNQRNSQLRIASFSSYMVETEFVQLDKSIFEQKMDVLALKVPSRRTQEFRLDF